jgi:hypothetical protein
LLGKISAEIERLHREGLLVPSASSDESESSSKLAAE